LSPRAAAFIERKEAADMAVSHARRFSGMTQNLPDGMPLQRIQERKECLFLFRAQFAEALPLVFGLAAVALDGAFQRQGPEIMHVPGVHAESPQRHGAQLIRRVLRRILDDRITFFAHPHP
jgi:hypothetical protein